MLFHLVTTMSFIIYLFSILLASQLCFAQVSTDVNIRCVALRDCPDLAYITKARNQEYVQEILSLASCGYDNNNYPKVWCPILKIPICTTPNQKPGRCKPIEQCEAFRKLLEAPENLTDALKGFIYRHKCQDSSNPKGFSVCCPNNVYEPYPTKPVGTTNNHLLPRPAEGECGQQLIFKIIGGQETELDEHPWTALLEYDDGSEISQACGGTLISNRYVVTAAHCADSHAQRLGNLATVVLGEYETRNETDCIVRQNARECSNPVVRVPVEEIILHPLWNSKPPATINHDIALLRLETPVTFSDYIKPICLPTSNLVLQDNQKLEVVGWGQTENGKISTVKLKTEISVFNRNQCATKYKQEKRLNIGDGEFCVGGEQGKDSCTGDSGGPLTLLVQRKEYIAWFLAGVVSFGPNKPCGVKNYPGLYTYLPKYVDWIHATVKP